MRPSTSTGLPSEHGTARPPDGDLAELLRPVAPSIALAFGCGLVAAALGLVPAIGVTALAERALDGTLRADTAWPWLAGIAVGLLGGHMLHLWGTGYAHRVELRFRTDLRHRIAVLLARLPLGWHTQESSGRVRSTITEDTAKVHALIAHFGPDLGLAIGSPLLGLAYLLTRSWLFTLILLAWLVVTVTIAVALASRTMTQITAVFNESEKQLAEASVELTDGIATVKAFGLSGTLFARFSTALDRYTKASYEWMRGPGRPMAILNALMGPAFMLLPIILTGWVLVDRGIIAPVDVLPFLLVGVSLPGGIMNLASMGSTLMEARDAATRIGILLAEPQLPEPETPIPVGHDEDGGVSVSFEHVSFRYGSEGPLALDDVNLELRPGTVTAVVGPSGGGKSTLVRLVARFWDVTDGVVRVGGTNVRDASSQDLLSRMSIVLQEGGQLSGGERQRIALARAFLADAPVLLLDEATAQADPHSERGIQEALARLAQGRTVLVIAHRLATVVDADLIAVLDGGRVVQQGTHTELLAFDGLYRTLWEAQQ